MSLNIVQEIELQSTYCSDQSTPSVSTCVYLSKEGGYECSIKGCDFVSSKAPPHGFVQSLHHNTKKSVERTTTTSATEMWIVHVATSANFVRVYTLQDCAIFLDNNPPFLTEIVTPLLPLKFERKKSYRTDHSPTCRSHHSAAQAWAWWRKSRVDDISSTTCHSLLGTPSMTS